MLIELCSWQARPGGVPAALAALRAAPPLDASGQGLAGVWTVDTGEVNRVVHVWCFADRGQRERLLAEAAQGIEPMSNAGSIDEARSELLTPAPFSPPVTPRQLGSIYEFRSYTLPVEAMPDLIERWSEVIEWRQQLSPLVGVWYTPNRPLATLVHVWAYRDANDWQRIRGLAKQSGKWPPPSKGQPSAMLKQSSFIALPAGYSPLR